MTTTGQDMHVARRKIIGGQHNGYRYQLAAKHDHQDTAQKLGDDLLSNIITAIKHHPRSLQKVIGPSEMGVECSRAILHKLNQDTEPDRGVGWKPTIGTGVHAWLEDTFNSINGDPGNQQHGRWLCELKVNVGTVGGTEIWGSVDLFDMWTGTVIDWKIVGNSTLRKYRTEGPSQQYRAQAHLYGQGYANAGQRVNMVAIAFLPREGELTDSFIWTEPWNPQIAADTLARVDSLARLLAEVGIDQALAQFPPCTDRWCDWCGNRSGYGAPRPLPNFSAAPPAQPSTHIPTLAELVARENYSQ